MCREKMYPRALGPLDGKDNDALVVQILEGQASIAKQKFFFSTRRALLRILLRYARGQQLLAGRVFIAHTQRLQVLQTTDLHPRVCETRRCISFNF
jgi:hypothetical protein